MDLIKNCDRYKNDPDSVHELANLIIEERKYDESQQLELEKIREKSKLDLEIARIRANDKDNNTEVNCNDSFSVDSLIKREKAANIIIYLKDEDLKNYDKIKSIILQQFEPTPQSCLENFKKATRQNCESHVQFASRLTTNWEYYLKLRNVSNFEISVKLQRILWRENMDEPIKTFELSTVTYGTTSAPFLATRTLKQLALDEAGNFPLGSSVVMSDMYIDDVLTGAETLLEAKN
ncbi:DUF1758 domain-containing protein [Trichonephila clavipes]|nr:DUF1758 domain-containing protein [Trichonephila clavipes]